MKPSEIRAGIAHAEWWIDRYKKMLRNPGLSAAARKERLDRIAQYRANIVEYKKALRKSVNEM